MKNKDYRWQILNFFYKHLKKTEGFTREEIKNQIGPLGPDETKRFLTECLRDLRRQGYIYQETNGKYIVSQGEDLLKNVLNGRVVYQKEDHIKNESNGKIVHPY